MSGAERWQGKVALVTGASSGIGAAVAEMLGTLGLRVALAGRNRRRLEVTARRVRVHGEAAIFPCDHTYVDENVRLFRAIRARWGNLDVLVNCAAMRGGVSLLDTSWRELDATLDLNVRAILWCSREAVRQMRRKREGAIINLSSMVGHRVLVGTPAMYAATKHALRILTDGLRSEVAQRGLAIKVALISPGLTDTPWHSQRDGLLAGGKNYPHVPLQPRDVAEAVRFVLATPPSVQVRDVLLSSSRQPY